MKIRNRKESKKIAVMAAVIMGFMLFAFMPLASAAVTSFTVMPNTGIAGAVGSYDAYVITDGVTSINVIIPAGFIAVAPTTGGKEIARFEFFNSSTKAYYGHAIITANETDPLIQNTVDIYWELGGDAITTTQDVDYAAGATNRFESGFGDGSLAIITLPTETRDGSIEITINSTTFLLDAVMTSIKQFVRNPLTADDYVFSANGETATVSITAPSGRSIVFRSGRWYLDTTGDHICNIIFVYGTAGDTPLTGDVNQDGKDDVIVVRGNRWYVDTDNNHVADVIFHYGKATDTQLVGDVNQDGKDDIIVVRNGRWYVDTNRDHAADERFYYGRGTDIPLVGDVNQDGKDDTIVVRNGRWYVDTNHNHASDERFYYGKATDTQLVGDVNQDGKDDTIVVRNGRWYVDTNHNHAADERFYYGKATDIPLVGDIG